MDTVEKYGFYHSHKKQISNSVMNQSLRPLWFFLIVFTGIVISACSGDHIPRCQTSSFENTGYFYAQNFNFGHTSGAFNFHQVSGQGFIMGLNMYILVILCLIIVLQGTIILRIKMRNSGHSVKQDDEYRKQYDKIVRQHKELTDAIASANLIQSAVLPELNILNEYFQNYFLFFRPKHFVSGDFYWIRKKDGKILIAVADCTGHGLQGALLSLLGIITLNEILCQLDADYTDEILNELKNRITKNLNQSGDNIETSDSMDISLCIIDKEKMEMQFSGAFSPLYIISNNNLEVYRGDRIPIGYSLKDDIFFTRHTISIKEGDILYLFSDGYYDQFGGENRKKFMAKRFRHLLLDIYKNPMDKQKEWLDRTLNDWIADNDQVDDITVLGIKI